MDKNKGMKQSPEILAINASEENAFWCNDGQIFKNVKELRDGLNRMTDETFAYHSNTEKHDFSNWIRDIISDRKLANSLAQAATRQEAVKIVNSRLAFMNPR